RVGMRALPATYLLMAGLFVLPTALPILPIDSVSNLPPSMKYWYQSVREFNAGISYAPITLTGRMGWEEFVRDVAAAYNQLPAEDRRVAGIYTDWYFTASAIDQYGPQYGLPHAVSGALTYYLWGPGDSWDVMVIVTGKTNYLSTFFEECSLTAITGDDTPNKFHIFVCKKPKLSPNIFWPNLKNYH
ncbi:MAG TPA: hypothetical protein VK206_20875, partial [Anaerolineales bacterium]|nr:hypothetical protein [Anaerolineales bacterium]